MNAQIALHKAMACGLSLEKIARMWRMDVTSVEDILYRGGNVDPVYLDYLVREIGTRRLSRSFLAARHGLAGSMMGREDLKSVLPLLAAKRDGFSCVVGFADVNGLKAVNDSCGHLEGDRLIDQVQEIMNSLRRPSDLMCRYGGDEFLLVFLAPRGELELERLSSSVKSRFEALPSESSSKFSIGFSQGFISPSSPTKDLEQHIDAADKAMYLHKKCG